MTDRDWDFYPQDFRDCVDFGDDNIEDMTRESDD